MNDSIYDERSQIKLKIKAAKKIKDAETASSIDVPEDLTRTIELAKDKGSSSWLTTLPLEKYGFHLSKSEFRDAIALRYGWLPERLPMAHPNVYVMRPLRLSMLSAAQGGLSQ